MHSITLSFPTLSEMHTALSKMLGNVEREVITAEQAVVADVKKAVTGKSKPAAAPATPPATPAPAAAASAPAPAASAPSTASATPPAADAVDYPTLQKAVFKLAGIATGGRDAATALLAQFDVKTFKDLAADKWGDALTAVNAKIDELSVPA